MTTNVLNLPGDYKIKVLNGLIEIEAGATIDVIASSIITLESSEEIIHDAPITRVINDFEVQGDAEVQGDTDLQGNIILGSDLSKTIEVNAGIITDVLPQSSNEYQLGGESNTWLKLHSEEGEFYSGNNVGNPLFRPYNPLDIYDTEEHRRQGAVYFQGGVGIEKDLNVGGYIYGRIETANTTTFISVTATNVDFDFFIPFVSTGSQADSALFSDVEGIGDIPGLRYNPFTGKIIAEQTLLVGDIDAISTTTATLVVVGGIGVGKQVYVENAVISEQVLPKTDNTGSIGGENLNWAEGYIQDLYTKFIKTTSGPLTIQPKDPLTDIYGDIRVRGTNPIGTAPVVSNTLYVTEDGNDTNDGRAMDASRACRTIGGAVNSPYYQPGTQILVSAGHYLEDNPIRLKPYTSVRGSDIRTTFIEPINKTQDLFHLESGCYLNYMTFLNGRSGLLEGPYLSEYNRGAYATAFPPLEGNERIDLFNSPYVQNCTNQSGPWLKDGTMFVPNQVIQVPQAVGIGTWPANTSSIEVTFVQGVPEQNMHINSGQQNQGFFNARSLLLSNKPFLQEQIVKYVDDTFNSGTFVYDVLKCERDTKLIVESIALDLLQNSESESIFAGLQYWRQNGYVDDISGQITTTTAAITYLKSLAVAEVVSTVGSGIDSTTVGNRFDDILEILNTQTSTLSTGEFSEWITEKIISNGLASLDTNTNNAYNALIAAKETFQNQTINYINSLLSSFTYDSAKCARDVGLIVDSIALDILFDSTSQTTFAGVQYWDQSSYVSGIADEITTTTDAISFVKDLSISVLQNILPGVQYQTTISQNIELDPGTIAEANIVETRFDEILNILNVGTAGVSDDIIPNGLEISSDINVKNAASILQINKEYIKAETIAYITSAHPAFVYDQTKCSRDIGYILDSVTFDLLYGGNKQSIQSAVYYYGYDNVSTIPNEIPQVLSAYDYLKTLVSKIIKNETIENTYQLLESQVFDNAGSYIESLKAEQSIDTIKNIIVNGPSVADEPAPININRSESLDKINAATILTLNKNFLKSEVIAYVNTLYNFVYDQEKCRRDIGYIIDSVAFDLLHTGNKQSIKSGVYYFSYTSNVSEIENETAQTVQAYDFIKQLIPSIIKGVPVNPYQLAVDQVIPGVGAGSSLTTSTTNEALILQDKIDIITNIIRNGPSEVDNRIPINLISSSSTNVIFAYELLIENRDFIAAETIAYIDQTFGTFNYSREKCFRDVGILIENISYDAAFGGNEKSVQSGLAYYDGVISRIVGQESQTIAAIDYLNKLSKEIIVNTTCTDLYFNGVISTATYSQNINTALTGGEIASKSLNELFNVVTTIISNGPAAAPTIYKASNVDAAFVSSEILMQANKKFIQEDTINYINNVIYQGALPYSEIKCRRDTGLILDSITMDLKHYTDGFSQSTFAGLQYWIQDEYVGEIENQLVPTVEAITYLKDTTLKIIQNITPSDDLIARYQTAVAQNTSLEAASDNEVTIISGLFDLIIEIVNGNRIGWTDRIVPNGVKNNAPSIKNAVDLINANIEYLGYEITAFVDATNFNFVYDAEKCRRDIAYMLNAINFDLTYGGNRQSIQTGLYYYGFSGATRSIHAAQTTATINAFIYLSSLTTALIQNLDIEPLQENVKRVFTTNSGTIAEATIISSAISTITNIIENGVSSVTPPYAAISFTASIKPAVLESYDIILSNKEFLIEEVIAFVDQTFNANRFNYDEGKCYRDIGLIIDAVSQDILLGGNQKSIEAGLSYWSAGYNSVSGQETTTTLAINYAKNLSLQVIANKVITPQEQTDTKQIINTYFQYGGDYMPQEAVRRNFNIITTIIERGPLYAPPVYAGGGLFALTGISVDQVQLSPTVTSVVDLGNSTYRLGLSKPTIGPAINATLYLGDVLVFPLRDYQVEALSLEYTGSTSTWNQRKIDPIGSMGGSLVDGAVISSRSPIQSFVYDAFTQLTQGGRGVRITNDGYAQLVSVFTIFASVGVQVDNGGIASIVNSNANFGTVCLLAKGYGKRKFSGTVYNPKFTAFTPTTGALNPDFDQYYPFGFWPNGARIMAFIPDINDRPHISLVMEIVPPEGHINEQQLPGFLNAAPDLAVLNTGTITITGIDTEGIAIGNSLYIRDQFGSFTGSNSLLYSDTGTIVTDIGYQSVTLNKALTSGGGEPGNDTFFTLYFSGNSYFTVLSSNVSENPKPEGINILSTASTGLSIDQTPAHIAAIDHLNTLTISVINNLAITPLQAETTQVINLLVSGGSQAEEFINLRFNEIIQIISTSTVAQAEAVIPPRLRTTEGPAVQGAGSAVTLISSNIEFLADEVTEYMLAWYQTNEPAFYSFLTDSENVSTLDFIKEKCQRDTKIILQRLIYDIETGGRYNSVLVGLSYWSRYGTHHIIQLGENVRRTDLFPDGSTLNFYQRSYMSASGYVFEYVGAGIDYGALPQRGVADPDQGREVVMLDSGKVFFTSTDQNGDFRIGPGLVISQATGVLSGRTFTKSLFANMTPFILAIETGGG